MSVIAWVSVQVRERERGEREKQHSYSVKLLLLPYCSYFRGTFGKNFFSQQKPDKFSEKENYEILQTLFFLLLHLMTAKHHVQLDERTVAFNCFHLEKYKLFVVPLSQDFAFRSKILFSFLKLLMCFVPKT